MKLPDNYDTNEIARRLAAGESLTDIARALDGPAANPGDSIEAKSAAESARSFWNDGPSASPGDFKEDPIDSAFKAAHAAGGRGTDSGMQAYLDVVMTAAAQGDPRVAHRGVPIPGAKGGDGTNEQWLQAGRDRVVRGRDNQTRSRP
jgi:hypothetical protein